MALDPITTASALEDLGYTLDEDTAAGLIARASARIRGYAQQVITQVTDDEVTLPGADPLYLPQRPVTAVSKVEQILTDGSTVTLPDLSWQLRNNVIYGIGCREVWPYLGLPLWVKITYTHGYDPVPDEIIDVVGSVVERMQNQPAGSAMLTSRKIDDYAESFGDQTVTAASLLPGEKATIDRLLGVRRAGTVPV